MAAYPIRKGLLDALIAQESGGDNNAVSGKGAQGLTQIMPATANDPGYGVMPLQNNSPEEYRRLGNDYLGAMLNKYNGNEALALAAYNAGPGRVDKAGGIPNIPETRTYVDNILHALNPINSANASETPYGAEVTDPALLAQLNGGASQQGTEVTDPALLAQLNGETAPETASAFDALNGPGDMANILDAPSQIARHLASGLAGGVVGGGKELYSLATGHSGAEAAQQMQGAQQDLTYQAPDNGVGALAIQGFNADSPKNIFNPFIAPSKAVNALTDSIKVNNPKTGAAIEGAVGLSPLLMGGALLKKTPLVRPIADPIMAASRPAADPWTGQQVAATAPQDGGAAATTYAEQAGAANIHPDIQQAIAAAEQAGTLHEIAAQRHIESQSLPVPLDLTEGMATGDGALFSKEKNLRGTQPKIALRYDDLESKLVQNINELHDRASPDLYGSDHVANGEVGINAIETMDNAKQAAISALYKKAEAANGGQFPVDGAAFVNAADSALVKSNRLHSVPSDIRVDMDRIRNGGAMTFDDFERMRSDLADDSRASERAGTGRVTHAIKLIRDALENTPMLPGTEHIKPLFDAARAASKQRFDMMRDNPAYAAVVKNKIAPDDFITRFIVNGKTAHLKNMQEYLQPYPLAKQAIAAGAIDFLRKKAGIDSNGQGRFTQNGYNKALEHLTPKLVDLVDPTTAGHLNTLGNVARYIQEQKPSTTVNNSGTLTGAMALRSLNKLTFGGADLAVDHFAINRALAKGAGLKRD